MKRNIFLLIKIIIAFALLAFLYKINSSSFKDAFNIFTLGFMPFFLLSGCFFMLNVILLASRQLLLLAPMDIKSSFKDMFRFAYGGMFANMFLPAGIGYDVVRILHFKSQSSLFLVTGWILTDKIIGLIGLLILSITAVNIALLLSGSRETYILIVDFISIVSVASIMFLVLSKKATGLIMRVLKKIPVLMNNRNILAFIEGLKRYSTNRRKIIYAILLSVASSFMAIIGIGVLGYALGGINMAIATLIFAPVVMMSSIIPVSPGNIGWTEAVATGVSYAFGSSGGLTVFILWRIVSITFSVGGLPEVLNICKKKQVL